MCVISFHDSVKVFASNFDFLFTFTDTSLKRPYGMCISHDKVFITDIFVSVIFVFTLEGYIVSKYSFLTWKERYLLYPCGVAVDRNGDIYTCESYIYYSHTKILVLTHDEDMNYYFAHSSLNSPRDVKLHQDNVIVLDLQIIYGDTIELKVYSKRQELLKVIRVRSVYCQSFDVTPNSNCLISSVRHIYFVSENGKVSKKFRRGNILKNTNQSRIVVGNKIKKSIGWHIYQGNILWFVDTQKKIQRKLC